MKVKKHIEESEEIGFDNWCFGIVNRKLAEVYFTKKKNKVDFVAHCYVKKADYKTKLEKRYIKEDCEKLKLIYKNGQYTEIKNNVG
ncbi:hypothetical protein KKB06_00680 [Patescibacteria group bacterium]|nr:hypothetical protein [Patescibacteria group bacterium]